MAFPSVLIFHDVPESIDYEMTSKHSPDVIKGKIPPRLAAAQQRLSRLTDEDGERSKVPFLSIPITLLFLCPLTITWGLKMLITKKD